MLRKMNSADSLRIYRVFVVLCFLLFASVVRIVPHPWNFAPVGAMALFSGAKLGRSWQAFLLPIAALFCGDIFVGLYSLRLMSIVYFSFCLSVLIGIAFRRWQSPLPLSLATFLAASQFFVISNFAFWALGTNYQHTLAGLLRCYIAGLPYFPNTLAGDAFYAALFFGGFALVARLNPPLRESSAHASPKIP